MHQERIFSQFNISFPSRSLHIKYAKFYRHKANNFASFGNCFSSFFPVLNHTVDQLMDDNWHVTANLTESGHIQRSDTDTVYLCWEIHYSCWSVTSASAPIISWHMCSSCNFNERWNRHTCWPRHKDHHYDSRPNKQIKLRDGISRKSPMGVAADPRMPLAITSWPVPRLCFSASLPIPSLASPFADITCIQTAGCDI